MTTKQRKKNNIIDKNSHSNQDDVAKKASEGGEAKGSGSGGWVRVLVVLCYIVLVAAAGLAALYFQRVLEEMGQISRRTEESVQKNAELASRLESVLQQVDSLRDVVEGFEPAVVTMRAELDDVGGALRRGDVEARRAEDALRELQRELLQHLSRGMQEQEEARGRNSAERERALEQRLGELTRSIGDSVSQIRGAQGHAQVQIGDLRARLDGFTDPAPLEQGLLDVGAAVAELRAANQRAETTAETLRDRIGSLGAELETANQKAASAASEAESVRALVQNATGALERSMSAVEASVQALTSKAQSLQAGLEQAHSSIQSVAEGQRGAEALGEEVRARLRAVEETADALRASGAVQEARLGSLLSRSDSQERTLAALGGDLRSARSACEAEVKVVQDALREAAQAHLTLAGQVEALQSGVGELWSAAAILNSTQTEQSLRDSSMTLQLEGLGQQLEGLDQKLLGQNQELEGLGQKVEEQNQQLEGLGQKIKGQNQQLEGLGQKIEGQNQQLGVLGQELQGLRQKLQGQSQELAAMGEAVTEAQALNILKASVAQKNLRKLMSTVDGLLSFSNRVQGHVDAIASLQSALEETNASVSTMSKKYKAPDRNV